MAAAGLKVAVLTIDPAKRLADSLGLRDLSNEASLVDPAMLESAGIEMRGELWAMMLDAKETFDELIRRHAPDAEARDRILSNRIYRQLSNALAGSQEYMAMERLFELHEEGGYDLLVLDTPPSRHALDFLDAPQRLTRFIEGRSLQVFLKPAGLGGRVIGRGTGMALAVLKRITGADLLGDIAEFFQAFSGMVEGFQRRARRVNELLAAPGTAFLVVSGPQGESLEEAVYFHRKLADAGLPFAGAIVNRVHPHPGAAAGRDLDDRVSTLLGDAGLAARVLDNLADYRVLAERDRLNVAHLSAELGDERMLLVPELDEDVHDLAGLREMCTYLFP
jgi:anion-transporting  ArsA/GET3 family ATPase